MFGQRARGAFTDVQDSQSKNQPPKRARFAVLNCLQQIADAFLAHPFQDRHLVRGQRVNVAHLAHQRATDELFHHHFAETLDVHCAA